MMMNCDEPFAPGIFVDYVFGSLETVRIVAEALELKLALSCSIRLGSATVDSDEFVFCIVLIDTVLDWSAMPK
jgi:hypothetical protein